MPKVYPSLLQVIRDRQKKILDASSIQNYGINQARRPVIFKKQYIFDLPIGFISADTSTEKCMENRCLVYSIILGAFIERGKLLNQQPFVAKSAIMWKLRSSNQAAQIKACEALLQEFKALKEQYPILDDGSKQQLKVICPILAQHYNINVTVRHHIPCDTIIYTFPEKFDEKIPKTDLIQYIEHKDNEDDIAHIGLISYMKYYYVKDNGFMCIMCRKTISGRSNRHTCEKIQRPTCRMCKRIVHPKALLYASTKEILCRGSYDSSNPVTCDRCGKTCPNCKYTVGFLAIQSINLKRSKKIFNLEI